MKGSREGELRRRPAGKLDDPNLGTAWQERRQDEQRYRNCRQNDSRRWRMRRNGFMDPPTDRGKMAIGLTLQVLLVGMDKAEDEKDVEEQVTANGRNSKRFEAQANQRPFT